MFAYVLASRSTQITAQAHNHSPSPALYSPVPVPVVMDTAQLVYAALFGITVVHYLVSATLFVRWRKLFPIRGREVWLCLSMGVRAVAYRVVSLSLSLSLEKASAMVARKARA